MSDYLRATAIIAVVALGAIALRRRSASSVAKTQLRGPPRTSWLWGASRKVLGDAAGSREMIEEWGAQYGGLCSVPGPFGGRDTVFVTDPKAAAHILGKSDNIWHLEMFTRIITEILLGRGLVAADGANHKRQQKAIAPGFTAGKIREYSSIFYDCAHKLATKWTAEFETADTVTLDMNKWFSAYTLDSMGFAALGYDMGSLDERPSAIAASFERIAETNVGALDILGFLLVAVHPVFAYLPTPRNNAFKEMGRACNELSRDIIKRARAEEKGERSVMGLLVQAESARTGAAMSEEEIASQMRTLIAAGYESTSAALTWMLLELCKDPDLQQRVRAELVAAFPSDDPTHDELAGGLPLLDAVVHEVFRLYPAVFQARRTAQTDDVVPLLTPLTLPNGTLADKVVLTKGTTIAIFSAVINTSRALWGDDAAEFKPERWLKPLPDGAQAITGYHHVMTFIDGPKACLGRSFAVANMKVLTAVLLRRFAFELPGGPATQVVEKQTVVKRPTIVGEEGYAVPIRVRRILD